MNGGDDTGARRLRLLEPGSLLAGSLVRHFLQERFALRELSPGERVGVYRIERTYGAFYRVIPLPDGAMTDRATATFRDGVLEIRMPAPPEQVSRGRRLEVSRGDTTGGTSGQPASEVNRS